MTKKRKNLSNPYSSGGGGMIFETRVQASFLALLLTGAYAPCIAKPITKILLQGKSSGYDTDDIIIFTQDNNNAVEYKLLGQIKHTIRIAKGDSVFLEVIQSAWNDYNNSEIFTHNRDVLALITGPLSKTDINDVRRLLEWARHKDTPTEFFRDVNTSNLSSDSKRTKLDVFREALKIANNNQSVADDIVFEFLKHFHLLGYDLDIKRGVNLSLLHSLIAQYTTDNVKETWSMLVDEIQSYNQDGGTLTLDTLPLDIRQKFIRQGTKTIPKNFAPQPVLSRSADKLLLSLALVGSIDQANKADIGILENLTNGK